MSRRALSLPLRVASSFKPNPNQWVCQRCLATKAEPTPVPDHILQQTVAKPAPSPQTTQTPTRETSQTSRPNNNFLSDLSSLEKPLPQIALPVQYLQHSTSDLLHEREKAQRVKTEPHKPIVGVVVSAGKMEKTVKVRIPGLRWEKRIGKYYPTHTDHLVHDPNSSLGAGDVVSLHRLRVSAAVHHVVASIVAPFGTPVEQRPRIPTPDERLAAYKTQRFAKLERRGLRRKAAMGDAEAIRELRAMGLDPGVGVEAGKGEKGSDAMEGEKGQKLPKGVVPGGRHEVGKIDERARRNKGRAMGLEKKAEGNLRLATEVEGTVRRERGVSADVKSGTTIERGREN